MFSSFLPINKSADVGFNLPFLSILSVKVAVISSNSTFVPDSILYSYVSLPIGNGKVNFAGVVSTTDTGITTSVVFPASSVNLYFSSYTPTFVISTFSEITSFFTSLSKLSLTSNVG